MSQSIGVSLKTHAITHLKAVKAIVPTPLTDFAEPYLISASGDAIRLYAYDPASPEDSPELLGEIDAHWHDVTTLGLWTRGVGNDRKHVETCILSASLDGTLRRWQMEGMCLLVRSK
jgi:hypothetical protein